MMNERIKQLAEQAGFHVAPYDGINDNNMIKKFAELMHDECIDAVPTDLDPATYFKVLQAIKQHFGF